MIRSFFISNTTAHPLSAIWVLSQHRSVADFMKIGVLSKNQTFWATTEIMRALKEKHVEPVYLRTPEVHLSLEGDMAGGGYDKKSLRDIDAVIPRIGRSLTQLGIMILKQFQLMNIPS